ncbi:MAG: flagellar protein FliT [Casimicrobiaceae bacterium]
MQHEATLPATLPPLYDAMRHVARLMADAAEAADWETLDAARDCARLLTARIDTASASAPPDPGWSARRYAVLRDVLRQDARVREALQPTSPRLRSVIDAPAVRRTLARPD